MKNKKVIEAEEKLIKSDVEGEEELLEKEKLFMDFDKWLKEKLDNNDLPYVPEDLKEKLKKSFDVDKSN